MSKIAEMLLDKAAEIRASSPELVAIGLLKEAGFSDGDARFAVAQDTMEKAAYVELHNKGIDLEEATRMVKAAAVDVRALPGLYLSNDEESTANFLEGVADYVEKQAAYISQLEVAQAQAVSLANATPPEVPESLTKMARVGALTNEDLAAMQAMPEHTLTKIANAFDRPWEMGSAAGAQTAGLDPLEAFLMG